MNILALEFSSAQRSVALLSSDGHSSDVHEVTDAGGKGTRAFSLIEKVLSLAKLNRKEIDCLAVALGPGSYTGIRVAISIAQGWQLATGVRTAGISTADIIATQALETGYLGDADIVIDAQRGEIYWARYTLTGKSIAITQGLRLKNPAEIRANLSNEGCIFGPEATTWFPGAPQVFPSAAIAARLAFERQAFIPAEQLEPIYLRETSFLKAPPARIT